MYDLKSLLWTKRGKIANIYCTMNVQAVTLMVASVAVALAADPVPLRRDEVAIGWRNLFDGKSLRGWTAPEKNWDVRDGTLARTAAGGDLTYVMYRLPRDYEL